MTTASWAPAAIAATVPKRRGVELALVILASVIVTAADAVVELNVQHTVDARVGYYGAGFAALWIAAHIVVRAVAPHSDPVLLPVAALLNGLGLVLIHRLDLASAQIAAAAGKSAPDPDASLQVLWTAIGIVGFIAVLLIIRQPRLLSRYSYTFGLIGLVLLALPAVLPRQYAEVNGARAWIRFGGFSIQPGEFAKLALLVFFASYLVDKRALLATAGRRFLGLTLPRARDLGPVLVAWLASLAILIRETDLGMSLLFFGMFVVLLYVATERVSWLAIGVLLFGGGAYLAYQLFNHVQLRVEIWLHPFEFASDLSYQPVQALTGMGTGGMFGTGLGLGHPEIVPYANTDFIVSTIGEELGLFGLVAILVLYAILVMRGYRIGIAARDDFSKLLATGLATALGLQVFVIVGGVTGLIPLTGITTPFLSYGGSSLIASFALVALLLRISDSARAHPEASG